MRIDLDKNNIVIDLEEVHIRSFHSLQLNHIGFDQNQDKQYIYIGEEYEKKLASICKYLRDEGFDYFLSEAAEKTLNSLLEKEKEFIRLKQIASNYKAGVFEQNEFNKFRISASSLPRNFKDHQIKSAYHHLLVHNSADFSVPGSGKTATLLLTYETLRWLHQVNKLFVVGPPSCFTAWKNEFTLTLGRKPKTKILAGQPKDQRIGNYYNYFDDTELFLITFQSLANDYTHILKFFNHPSNQICFVVDEAHYIKQLEGAWANAVLNVGKNAISTHVLTGTPCPKSYTDLFNLFDLLWGENQALSESQKQTITTLEKEKDYQNAGTIISEAIGPLFYRVRKSDLNLTPQCFHPPIMVTMNSVERSIYDSIYQKISQLSKFDDISNIQNILALKRGRLIRLRQALSYPRLLSTAIDDYNERLAKEDLGNLIVNYDRFETPAKVSRLLDLVSNIRKVSRKIVIWSNFIETINLIEKSVIGIGIGCKHIYGSVPMLEVSRSNIESREKIINRFLDLDDSTDVLVANPAACAESISLHRTCHNTIYYDLSYNCAQYLQSLDRIHRVGGSENVIANYYHLLYQDTIDNDILSNLIVKRDKMNRVIEMNSDIYDLEIDVFDDNNQDEDAYDRLFRSRI